MRKSNNLKLLVYFTLWFWRFLFQSKVALSDFDVYKKQNEATPHIVVARHKKKKFDFC